MAFSLRSRDVTWTMPEKRSTGGTDMLPALLRPRDLALLIVLVTIIASDVQGMQFAANAVFFYWFLALVTFQLPGLWVFRWLIRQAPRHVPLYAWILRLTPVGLRSVLLFLMCWPGVLIALATLGMCVSLLSATFPAWLHAFPNQCLAFILLVCFATLLTLLPLRLFRVILWIGGLLYLGAFLFVACGALGVLIGNHRDGLVFHAGLVGLPTHFSLPLFGLAVLCLFGLNGPFLLDGEVRGTQRFLRTSTGSL